VPQQVSVSFGIPKDTAARAIDDPRVLEVLREPAIERCERSGSTDNR